MCLQSGLELDGMRNEEMMGDTRQKCGLEWRIGDFVGLGNMIERKGIDGGWTMLLYTWEHARAEESSS